MWLGVWRAGPDLNRGRTVDCGPAVEGNRFVGIVRSQTSWRFWGAVSSATPGRLVAAGIVAFRAARARARVVSGDRWKTSEVYHAA
jgi:hypothetical protein